jgi:hypothetical protein
VIWKSARVHRDSHVVFGERLYSVPWRYMHQEVWIRATASTIAVFADNERIATHSRRGSGHRSTFEEHLPDRRADLRHRSRSCWESRAEKIGPEAKHLVGAIFDSDDVLSKLRAVQAIVTHLEQFPRERARAACERALHFGSYSYQGLKSILRQGLDLGPVAKESPPPSAARPRPRFARSPVESLLPNLTS